MQRELTEEEILRVVHEIRLQAPGIGAYKLFIMLKEVFPNLMMGRDRFYRLMHEHHLMLKPERRRHTTNSNHNYRKYKNMVKGIKPTGINRLWVADITYIDTDEGVLYLHLLTDAYTHEIIGWTLSESLVARNTLAALDMGIERVGHLGMDGLVHHSDRGAQYCSNEYVKKLIKHGIKISMTEDYNPTDNAVAERVNGIIKQEWLYRMKRPADQKEATSLMESIIRFYNGERPHRSNPGMLPPDRFRQKLASSARNDSLEASRLQPSGQTSAVVFS